MLYSHDWLRAFVPHALDAGRVAELVSAHVATVDRIERLRDDLRDVVVARVVQAGRHPNADTLWVTKVDDGSGTLLDVVCGAPNVLEGTLYPFARAGTALPGGVRIEKRKIRGETSNGMLCSARELGLGEDAGGILALSVDVAPGTPLLEAMPLGDVRFDVDVLPNRPDLLSHLGLARELAAITGHALVDPPEVREAGSLPDATTAHGATEASSGGATVRLEDAEGCPRYMGAVIRGVKVGPSPDWLVRRLEALGLRPISNVVDATNYFLHGYGQPMHAFDLARLERSTIVVRRARPGERLVTLDGHDRALDPSMTVIADDRRAVAVAGVMGGRESEVSEATTDVFLEVAYFSPRRVRQARRALGLSTDASYRFERGIDPQGTARALRLAAAFIVKLAGGTVDGAAIDVGQAPPTGGTVTLSPSRVGRLLGDRVPATEITTLLQGIGFDVAALPDGNLRVVAPSWRLDVSRDADLVEEVARLRGYDALSDELQPFRPGSVPDHPLHLTGRRVRDALVALGLAEVRPMPFVKGDDSSHVRVQNPLADDEPHLRRSLLETLARRTEYNLTRMQGNVRLFEIGSAFTPRGADLPHEEMRAAAVVMGQRRPPHFTEPSPPAWDAWDAKALAERVAQLACLGEPVALVPGVGDTLWWVEVGHERGARRVGSVTRLSIDLPPWASPAFGVEVTLATMPNELFHPAVSSHGPGAEVIRFVVTGQPARFSVRSLPTTPAAEFDLALLLPDGTTAAEVERVLRLSAGELLERLELFDEYRGAGLPAGTRSVAWRLTFRDPVRTLRDKEIEGRRQKILRALESELGVRPRTA